MAAALVRGEVPDTDCSLCHEAFKEPKILPCGHVLCRPCLLSWLRTQPQPVCPLCRCAVLETGGERESQGTKEDRPGSLEEAVGALPTDLALAELVEARALLDKDHTCCVCEDVAATSLCLHCRDMLCAACRKAHEKMTTTKHHTVQDLSSLTPDALTTSRPSPCSSHPDEACRLFCPAHDLSVCLLCAAARHRSCPDLKDLEVITEEARAALADMAASLSASEHTLREAIQQLDRHVQTTAEQIQTALDCIQETCDQLESGVKSCRGRMTELVREAGSDIQKRTQAAIAILQGRKAVVTSHTAVVTRAEGSKAHVTVSEMSAVMGTRVQQLDCGVTLPVSDAPTTMTFSIDDGVVSTVEKALAELGRVNLVPAHHWIEASGGEEKPDDTRDKECNSNRHGGAKSTPQGSLASVKVNPTTDGTQATVPPRTRETELVAACLRGSLAVVKSLVDKGQASLECCMDMTVGDQHYEGMTPLWAASKTGNVDIVKYLTHKGASVGGVPLREACYQGHLEVVRHLLERGAGVNTTDTTGWTALMYACDKGHVDIVTALLAHGAADINTTNTNGWTALMHACKKGHVDIVTALLAHGADVNIAVPSENDTSGGRTALHYNAINGNVPILELLLLHGATFSRDCHGNTPLLLAACNLHDDYVDRCLRVPDVSRSDKADALEVLGAKHWVTDKGTCPEQWQRAMEERHRAGSPAVCKKTATKVAAYGLATEFQTPQELQQLQQCRDRLQLGTQAALIAERVLGKVQRYTDYIVRVNADVYAAADRFDRAMALVLHSLENLSAVNPFLNHSMLCHAKAIDVQVKGQRAGSGRLLFSYGLAFLRRTVSAVTRAEAAPSGSQDGFPTERQHLLRIVLHAVCLLQRTLRQASPAERRDYLQAVRDLVGRNFRGQGGDTLLHMACDAHTEVFNMPTWKFPYKCCPFPSPEVVQALLAAGCDRSTRNAAGLTALQVAGDHSEIVRLL